MPSIGDRLAGRYRLDARIGSGGFATVFRAHDLRLDRDVAVKVLLANHATDPVVTARFEREARVLAAINHPNVVAIHDVASGRPNAGSEPYLVMDLCAGGSLADLLKTSPTGSLSPDILIPILIDVSAGLAALHAGGIVHRDLKPSNVLLSRGRAQIADLGIAVVGPSDLTATGTAVGTLAYLAPEQLSGAPASSASDVHALGAIAFLGLTGRLPSPAESVAAVVAASAVPVDPVSVVAPGLGAAFDQSVARALAPDPSGRPTASDFRKMLSAALERWRARPGSPAARLAPALLKPRPAPPSGSGDDPTTLVATRSSRVIKRRTANRRQRRRPAAVIGTLVVVLALGFLALLVASRSGNGATPPLASGSSASPVPSPTPIPTVIPSASASPSTSIPPTPAPTPSATVDPYAAAQSASQTMRSAIAAARGPNGLNGKNAKDLGGQLDQFDQALNKQDSNAAQEAANKLASQVADLIDHGDLAGQTAAQLQAAANGLVAAANALPG
jgi:serine/threonine protein kinase